jgi:peptidyl-prolyl cis-trans isomerase A (cyclophilin A)
MIAFVMAGRNTRTTQVFINTVDNPRLDGSGYSPFGKVVEGMDAVDGLYSAYGEGRSSSTTITQGLVHDHAGREILVEEKGYPTGSGPDQSRIQSEGNAYLKAKFPNLDYIKTARIVPAKQVEHSSPSALSASSRGMSSRRTRRSWPIATQRAQR